MKSANMITVSFQLNGVKQEIKAPPMKRLIDVLREDLKLTGTKEGCGEGECGACSIIIDEQLANSCLIPICQVEGAKIHTVEGLATQEVLNKVQQAFL